MIRRANSVAGEGISFAFIFASGVGGIGRKGLREEQEEKLESHQCPLPKPMPPTPRHSALSCRRSKGPKVTKAWSRRSSPRVLQGRGVEGA